MNSQKRALIFFIGIFVFIIFLLIGGDRFRDFVFHRDFIVLIIIFAIVAPIYWFMSTRRKKILRKLSSSLGFQYSETDTTNLFGWVSKLEPQSLVFKTNPYPKNILRGDDSDSEFYFCEYQMGKTLRSAYLFNLKRDLGVNLLLKRRMSSLTEKLTPVKFWGNEEAKRVDPPLDPEFTKTLSLFTNNEEKALRLINSEMADHILANKRYIFDITISIHANLLLISFLDSFFFGTLFSEKQFQQFLDFAKGIKDRIVRNA